MKVFVLAVTTAAVLLLVSTPIQGSASTLKTWLDQVQSAIRPVERALRGKAAYSEETPIKDHDDIFIITQTKAIMAAVSVNLGTLDAYVGDYPDSTEIINPDHVSPTNYLTWKENQATALLLDRNWGNFFFTARLSGCEVWIAYSRNHEPLIIHTNAKDTKDAVDKLRNMEAMAYEVLKHFNKDIQEQEDRFSFSDRIRYNYAEEDDVTYSDEEMANYWVQFNQKNVNDNPYIEDCSFYGFYDPSTTSWHFSLKQMDTGTLQASISVQLNTSTGRPGCTIL